VTKHTIYAIEDANCVEEVPANRAGVCLLRPRPNARIMNNVLASVKSRDNIEMICSLVILWFVGVIRVHSRGWYLECAVRHQGRARRSREWERIQAYNALFWLRHDADQNGKAGILRKTCKLVARNCATLW
jgi:hypothetical protein